MTTLRQPASSSFRPRVPDRVRRSGWPPRAHWGSKCAPDEAGFSAATHAGAGLRRNGFSVSRAILAASFTAPSGTSSCATTIVAFGEFGSGGLNGFCGDSRSLADCATAITFSGFRPPSRISATPLEIFLCALKCRMSMFSRCQPGSSRSPEIVLSRAPTKTTRLPARMPPPPGSLPCLRRIAETCLRAGFLRELEAACRQSPGRCLSCPKRRILGAGIASHIGRAPTIFPGIQNAANLLADLVEERRVVLQDLLGCVAALSDLGPLVAKPGSPLSRGCPFREQGRATSRRWRFLRCT